MVEQWTENPCVPGSIPGGTTKPTQTSGFFIFTTFNSATTRADSATKQSSLAHTFVIIKIIIMKIIVTGSLGHISKPLTKELVLKGHNVVVISSQPQRKEEIEAFDASAAIGSLEDVQFLTDTFAGADAVYTMVPPNNYFDHSLDLLEYYRRIGHNYQEAIQHTGVQKVVNLSSIGAHLNKGNGILIGANNVEGILNSLPLEVSITHIRPTSFYYNLYGYIDMIKKNGFIAANYGDDDIVPWVSPNDIAAAIADELLSGRMGRTVRYVCSEEATCSKAANILGEAIGIPDLNWITVSDEEVSTGLKTSGMNPQIAHGLTEMYSALHSGLLSEDYYNNRPTVLGKVKLADFAKEFAAAFKSL